MRRFQRITLIAPAAAILLLAAHPTLRKDPIGVYGLIDRVVLEPAEGTPERIQLWGVFALANSIEVANGDVSRIDLGAMDPAKRGYLYYTVNRSDEATTRREWTELQALAGTSKPVAFGSRMPPVAPRQQLAPVGPERAAYFEGLDRYNGRLRRASETPTQPDTFPLRMKGASAANMRAELHRSPAVYQVLMVPEAMSPADGGTARAGQVRLVARNLDDPSYLYHFEILGPNGAKEASGPIAAGEGQTTWSPAMKVHAGEGYTWRVWVKTIGTGESFPPAEATFRAKD